VSGRERSIRYSSIFNIILLSLLFSLLQLNTFSFAFIKVVSHRPTQLLEPGHMPEATGKRGWIRDTNNYCHSSELIDGFDEGKGLLVNPFLWEIYDGFRGSRLLFPPTITKRQAIQCFGIPQATSGSSSVATQSPKFVIRQCTQQFHLRPLSLAPTITLKRDQDGGCSS